MVRITIRPLAAHCRKYSTRKKVSKISIPCVGCGKSGISSWLTGCDTHLVQQHYVCVQQEVTRHVQSLLLRQCQVCHACVLHLVQPKIFYKSIYLQEYMEVKEYDSYKTHVLPVLYHPCPW